MAKFLRLKYPYIIVFLSFLSLDLSAQMTVQGPKAKVTEPTTAAYDSLSNYLWDEPEAYVGQRLWLIPKKKIAGGRLGYMDFYQSRKGNYGEHYKPDESYSVTGTPIDAIAGHSFQVMEVYPKEPGRLKQMMKLYDEEAKDICYYEYSPLSQLQVEYGKKHIDFPFIVYGYMEKTKKVHFGKQYVFNYEARGALIDPETGERPNNIPEGTWTCQDVLIFQLPDNPFNQTTCALCYKMVAGNGTVALLPDAQMANKNQVFPLSKANALKKKYGSYLYNSMLSGEVEIGMSEELVEIICGLPDDITNVTVGGTHGSHWYYEHDPFLSAVYFTNGKVSSIVR